MDPAQNQVTFEYLQSLPLREPFRRRITELWDYPRSGFPGARWPHLVLEKLRVATAGRAVLPASLEAPATVVIDPNALSPDGSISLAQSAPSPDGKLLAYALSEGGKTGRRCMSRTGDRPGHRGGQCALGAVLGISWTNDGEAFSTVVFRRRPKASASRRPSASIPSTTIA